MSVVTERHDRVLVIRLDRVAKRNAIDAETTTGLDAALNRLDDDPDLWVGILTGSGGYFSAGTDLAQGSGEPTDRGGEYGLMRRHRSTPLIAAVEGLAFGGGFELALACDLIVAARDARFGLPEVVRGVIATSGALFRAPRALPLNVAREMLLTGEPLSAERAWTLGLVNELAESGGVLDAALGLAARICANSPSSVRITLHALDALVAAEDEVGWSATKVGQEQVRASADMKEGISAFFEKRSPHWTGR
ncbi:MAG: Enoyl-CoA hydratase/isomerase [Pseudonocardiales bacterium]|nr:Enoyl-CoA hydratase/isomerase [Pseudonocardiales bacterium]